MFNNDIAIQYFSKLSLLKIRFESYLYQIIGKILPQIVSLVTQGLFANFSGLAVFGRFFLLGVIWSSTYAVFAGGTDNYFQKTHRRELIFSALIYKIVISILVCILITPLLLILKYSLFESVIFNFGLGMMALVEVQLIFFRVINKDKFVTYQKTIQILTLFALMVTVKPNSLLEYGIIFSISWGVPLLISSVNLLLVNREVVELFYFINLYHIKRIMLLGLSIMSSQIYHNADFIVLERLQGPSIAGSYKVSILLASAILPVIQGIGTVFFF
jgi:hypothetical protein